MNQYPTQNSYSIVYQYAAIISIGSLVFGIFIGVFNSIQGYEVYYNDLQNDPSQKSIFVGLCNSLLAIGAIIGSLLALIFQKVGISYKFQSITMDIIGILSCSIMIIDLFSIYIYIGRLLCGIYTGVQTSICVIYIKEISPSEVLGKAGTFNQLFVTIGLATSFTLSFFIPQQFDFEALGNSSRQQMNNYIQNYKLRVQLIQLIPMLFMLLRIMLLRKIKLNPPQYNIKEYETYFTKIYHTENEMQIKIKEIKDMQQLRNMQSANIYHSQSSNLGASSFWKRFAVGFILSGSLQFTGINIIIFYSNDIFQKMGSGESAKVYTLILGLLQTVFTLISTKYIERYGRKLMLLLGEVLIIVGLVVITISSHQNLGLLSLFAILMHLLGFSISFGPVVWVYIVEILEEKYVFFMSLNSWLFTIFIGLGVPFLMSVFNLFTIFLIFSMINVLILVFLIFFVIETKGKTFNQISNEYYQINNTDINNVPHIELQ
ncbi:hypothetical protein ABPG72_008732 [Tetrahymena utriculariae]